MVSTLLQLQVEIVEFNNSISSITKKHLLNIINGSYHYVFERVTEQRNNGTIVVSILNFISHKNTTVKYTRFTLGRW